MPWIMVSQETKNLIRQKSHPNKDFLPNERSNGEIFIDSEVYEALKQLSPNLDDAIQLLCLGRQA